MGPLQTLRRRVKAPEQVGPFFAWHDLKRPAFNVLVLGGILGFLGLFTRRFRFPILVIVSHLTQASKVLTYIDLSATEVGISPEFTFYLVSIANAGSGLGRISSGILADKFGVLTVIGPLTLLCAVVTYIWPFVTTKETFIAIGIVYGFCSGAFISLIAVPVIMMGDMHDSGRRVGSYFTCLALGAVLGPPISGAIAQGADGFKAVGCYAGIVLQSLPSLSLIEVASSAPTA